MPKINNPEIYKQAKCIADETYKKPSAFKSGFIVKTYKELGGKYINDNKERKLKRWFAEDWRDVGKKKYPVYRPHKRVNEKTPLTISEIDPINMIKQIKMKQLIRGNQNLPPFQKINLNKQSKKTTKQLKRKEKKRQTSLKNVTN